MVVATGMDVATSGLWTRTSTSPTLRDLVDQRRRPTLGAATLVAPPSWRDRVFAPGWPLVWMFVLFPLWWVTGLTEWAPLALTVPMVLHLLRRKRVELPKGFGLWALFLVWSLAGVTVLSVPAFGAVIDSGSTRIITFGYRLVWYLACTVVCLYVLNTRDTVSRTKVVRVFSMMFIWVICGGILGLAIPSFQFPSLMELVLPSAVTDIQFIYHMVHPSAAQLQDVLGYSSPRPSAPFTFTNTWGVNLAVLLPFFVIGWCSKDSGWRRTLAPLVGLAALVAVVFSLNRGLWAALAAAGLFLAVRACLQGRPGILAGLVAVILVGGAVIQFTPLGTVIQDRFSSDGSINGRTNLSTLTVNSVARTSPLIGLGSTRNVQGNFNSIAGGATAQCPRCSPPALGTQGQLWLVVFSDGFVGLFLYLAFFVLMFLRGLRARSGFVVAMLCVLVLSTVTMPVYNSIGTALMTVLAAVGLLGREYRPLAPGATVPRAASLTAYTSLIRSHWVMIVVLALVGTGAGAGWQAYQGTPVRAVISVVLPDDRGTSIDATSGLTIDSEAQFVNSGVVTAAVASATTPEGPNESRALRILATPNSRVLHISYLADHSKDAVAGAGAAAAAYMQQRDAALQSQHQLRVASLEKRSTTLKASLTNLSTTLAQLRAADAKAPLSRTEPLRSRIQQATSQLRSIDDQLVRQKASPVQPSRIIAVEPTKAYSYVWTLSLVSGFMCGLLLGLVIASWRDRGGGRLGRRADAAVEEGLPVLLRHPRRRWFRLPRRGGSAWSSADILAQLAPLGVDHVVPVDGPPTVLERPGAPVHAIVCAARTPYRDLAARVHSIRMRGGEVLGIVI